VTLEPYPTTSHRLNRRVLSRAGAAPGKELYIVAGPVGRKGSIGKKEKIAVPAKNWKVIVVLDRQGLGMQGVNANTRTIAVMMPNDSSVKGKG
jgi:endonuclease G